jgi:hypothetical protein
MSGLLEKVWLKGGPKFLVSREKSGIGKEAQKANMIWGRAVERISKGVEK